MIRSLKNLMTALVLYQCTVTEMDCVFLLKKIAMLILVRPGYLTQLPLEPNRFGMLCHKHKENRKRAKKKKKEKHNLKWTKQVWIERLWQTGCDRAVRLRSLSAEWTGNFWSLEFSTSNSAPSLSLLLLSICVLPYWFGFLSSRLDKRTEN